MIALLIMLSRGPRNPHEYVRAMGYNHTCSSIDHNGHHSVPCEDCLRHHHSFNQRRQSSEDFLDYHQTRTHMDVQEPLCTGCPVNGTELCQMARVCTCANNMIEMKCLSTDNTYVNDYT